MQTRVGLSVENSFVVGNVATRNGAGGTYVSTDSTLRVSNTTFENNKAGDRGGESVTHFVSYLPEYIFRGLFTQSKFRRGKWRSEKRKGRKGRRCCCILE